MVSVKKIEWMSFPVKRSSSRPGFKKLVLMIFWWVSFPIKWSQKFPRNLPIRVKIKFDNSGVLFADFDTTNVQERIFYQKCTRVTNQLHTWMMTVSIKVGDTCPSTFFDWSFKDMTRVHLTCYHDSSVMTHHFCQAPVQSNKVKGSYCR